MRWYLVNLPIIQNLKDIIENWLSTSDRNHCTEEVENGSDNNFVKHIPSKISNPLCIVFSFHQYLRKKFGRYHQHQQGIFYNQSLDTLPSEDQMKILEFWMLLWQYSRIEFVVHFLGIFLNWRSLSCTWYECSVARKETCCQQQRARKFIFNLLFTSLRVLLAAQLQHQQKCNC